MPTTLIEKYTPESAEVTKEMAIRLKKMMGADAVVSVTGLTTSGGSEGPGKPVGTMFYCVLIEERTLLRTAMNYKKQSFFYRNSLSIVFICLFILALGAQAIFGWKEHNEELKDLGGQQIIFSAYLRSGHFFSATFENFESEFLSVASIVILTIFLRQKGSPESKPVDAANAETGK